MESVSFGKFLSVIFAFVLCQSFKPLFSLHLLGKEDIVKLLIDNNADINAKNKDGHTPLHFSAQYGEN